jgi:hypothetical protein
MKKENAQALIGLAQKIKLPVKPIEDKPLNWDELIKICLANKKYDLKIPRRQIRELRDPFEG